MYIVAVKDERGALIAEAKLQNTEIKFGRSEENEICLASDSVSRQHACLYIENEQVYIADMGSSNGVYIDDQRIHREAAIDENSRIRIAEFHISLECPRQANSRVPGVNTAIYSPHDAHAKLVVVSGPQIGREILLFDPVSAVGRTDENDISLPDISISRHHARLHQQNDGSYVLQDLGSSNGTHVHGRRVNRPVRILIGDRVHFGNIECILSQTTGVSTPRRSVHRWIIYGLLFMAAAVIGTLSSLLFNDS